MSPTTTTFALLIGVGLAGCAGPGWITADAQFVGPPGGVLVTDERPPDPIVEEVPLAPGPGYAWVAGYWNWNGVGYVWVPGHYRARPEPGVVWVPQRWARVNDRYELAPGRWEAHERREAERREAEHRDDRAARFDDRRPMRPQTRAEAPLPGVRFEEHPAAARRLDRDRRPHGEASRHSERAAERGRHSHGEHGHEHDRD